MSGWSWVTKCKITASYGRKLVETMARPPERSSPQRTMSSGDWDLRAALAACSSAGVITG